MTCFRLPKWVINRIDRARRSCLWGKHNASGNGISLCNWNMAIIPRKWGGLGLPDLNVRNITLLLRWWWKPYSDPGSMWASCVSKLRTIIVQQPGILIWAKKGSFFWNQLHGIKGVFDCSNVWIIGNGAIISYWFDNWGQGVLANQDFQIQFRKCSLRLAAGVLSLPVHDITLNQEVDSLAWRWSATGKYSAGSIYKIMSGAGKIKWRFQRIWKFKIPPTVKLFLFFLLRGKVLTREVMRRRNFQCEEICEMCSCNQIESAMHLFFQCQYAKELWRRLGMPSNGIDQSVEDAWLGVSTTDPILSACAIWEIWKSRNAAIFEEKRVPLDVTVQWIIHEATLWKKFC